MGFLKRIFSLGGKKNKKQRPQIIHNGPFATISTFPASLLTTEEEEHEAAVGRLLRSSSARFAVVKEVDYTDLPPLPHPINQVIQTPSASTVSIASTTLSQRGTYTVTVHGRQRHTSTEFPIANRNLDVLTTPPRKLDAANQSKDDNNILRLRSDPSVASLLSLYDEHGRLSSKAFSNSPPSPPKERAQCRRNGSTLRQLLGAPASLSSQDGENGGEGDISWAERFLGETDDASSMSSLGPNTPRTSDLNSSERHDGSNDISVSTSADLSGYSTDNPAISSMNVELSITTESSRILDLSSDDVGYGNTEPATPRRASRVFDFLTAKKSSKPIEVQDRSLPELPSVFSSPSNEGFSFHEPGSHFSDCSSESHCAQSIPRSDDKPQNFRSISRPKSLHSNRPLRKSSFATDQTFYDEAEDYGETEDASGPNKIKVILTAPTKVIVTAPTPSAHHDHDTSTRIPRGPRAPTRRRSSSSRRNIPMLGEHRENMLPSVDKYTAVPTRHKNHRRSTSHSSASTASYNENEKQYVGKESKPVTKSKLALAVKSELPLTPLRTNSALNSRRSLLRTAVTHSLFQPPPEMAPSPASSSEMSPVGRQLMMDVRKQRHRARETEREKNGRNKRLGSGRSQLGY